MPPLMTAAGQVTASTFTLLPVALSVDHPWALPMLGLQIWGALVGLALLSTAVAYVLYFRILAAAGATNLLLVTFLIPMSALSLGMTILGERLDPRHFAGMALIGLGLAAIDGRPLRLLRGTSPTSGATDRAAVVPTPVPTALVAGAGELPEPRHGPTATSRHDGEDGRRSGSEGDAEGPAHPRQAVSPSRRAAGDK